MPTTKHTYQCIQRFDPAIAPEAFDQHDAAYPRPVPDDAEPSPWRRYCDALDDGRHDPSSLPLVPGSSPIVYTLRGLTRPEAERCREVNLMASSASQEWLAIVAFALVAVDGPSPLSPSDITRRRVRHAGILPHVPYDDALWSDDDVMPDGAVMGLATHATRRWALSRRERTFRAAGGPTVGVG